jgi:hypothetical protein
MEILAVIIIEDGIFQEAYTKTGKGHVLAIDKDNLATGNCPVCGSEFWPGLDSFCEGCKIVWDEMDNEDIAHIYFAREEANDNPESRT